MPIDTSTITYFLPLIGFLFVVVLLYAIIIKTRAIGSSKYIAITLALLAGLIFISLTKFRDYIIELVPYLISLIIIAFFLLILLMFLTKDFTKIIKPLSWVFVIAFALIIIILAMKFFPSVYQLLPKTNSWALNSPLLSFKHWLYSKKIVNSIVFIIAAAIVTVVITRK